MVINIVYSENRSGLSKDAKIIANIFKKHNINYIDFNKEKNYKKADCNIFLQNFGFKGPLIMELAKTNIIIPNQEWLNKIDLNLIKQCQLVVCKTKYCYDLLKYYNSNIILTGFISEDLFFPSKKINKVLHFKGLSAQKNTECLLDNDNIIIYDPSKQFKKYNIINRYLHESEKSQIFNSFYYHACPSLNEGWGHYVYEALGCGATPILSNAPFFDEIPKDLGIFIPTEKKIDESIKFSSSLEQQKFPLRESFFVKKESINIIINMLSEYKFNSAARNFFLESNFNARKKIEMLVNI